jgi:putative FmdB family regulatory protein
MHIYESACESCGQVEEIFPKFSDKPLSKCGHCSGKVHKLISQSSFHLKGTGWYVTDYAGKKSGASVASKEKDKSGSTKKKEAKASSDTGKNG